MEKGLRHLLIISSTSYFFNKTDFELYLFKDNQAVNKHKKNQIFPEKTIKAALNPV